MRDKIRFFHFHNDEPVKITIRRGQTLAHYFGESTDEGWRSEAHAWTFDGRTLEHEATYDGRDCDGRLTQYFAARCPAGQIQAGAELEGVRYPAWQDGGAEQRDEYAEAMNY